MLSCQYITTIYSFDTKLRKSRFISIKRMLEFNTENGESQEERGETAFV
jgi:hypothetical protein